MPRKVINQSLSTDFIDSIPTHDLVSAFSTSDDARFQQLGEALLDPRYSRTSFLKMLAKFKIPLAELIEVWRKYNLGLGLAALYARTPKVLHDTVVDAESNTYTCYQCGGKGNIDGQICPVCNGEGERRIMGDKDSRKLVFDSLELTNRPGKTEINVGSNNQTNNIVFQNFRTTIEQANKALDKSPAMRQDLIEAVDESQIVDTLVIEGEKVE